MLLDIPSRQDFETLTAKLDAALSLLSQVAARPSPDDFMSLEQVAAYTGFDRRTVEQWRTQGRYNAQGRKVYLQGYEFSGRWRFKRADVEAFGLGIGVLEPATTAGERPAPARKAPSKKPVPSEKALRRVA
ncbi:helix-turn-helix domain-containing protein [Hymenobacter sp. ASUV-10]|uniref:Helix-turn-helix domain-containing protein n=1 Tax=Hymenobacter aranciens TaxID=3063996 RepID=A0ABT9BEQ2_9BACT|nr:helix-turn-helix domain-containing protein [Hymenobacter sp. ASUV-10]MDO7875517.1 helix-turn-helix domain-containing protein [Hymenobacter sp. ASUV-10]